MTLKLVLDRFEENIAVCIDNDGNRHLIDKSIIPNIKVNDIFNIELDENVYHSPLLLIEETAQKKEEISSRMKKIFNMTRHRRPPKL
jgi:hypothetical protein